MQHELVSKNDNRGHDGLMCQCHRRQRAEQCFCQEYVSYCESMTPSTVECRVVLTDLQAVLGHDRPLPRQ